MAGPWRSQGTDDYDDGRLSHELVSGVWVAIAGELAPTMSALLDGGDHTVIGWCAVVSVEGIYLLVRGYS
ncbi:hypothetical protein ON058_01735 [Demequina sp. B12]|uniref:hypothetical protein n=1 Tax=Demequina sp. B12 TaxID=2992757 RepID=UPI00237B880C|nr:hypothetical protein [Demequina sp. B12]MDE0572131.1 hypothetical protein [Demequina sp. B12]